MANEKNNRNLTEATDPTIILPYEVFIEIFSYLEPRDLMNTAIVCYRWERLVKQNWRIQINSYLQSTYAINLEPEILAQLSNPQIVYTRILKIVARNQSDKMTFAKALLNELKLLTLYLDPLADEKLEAITTIYQQFSSPIDRLIHDFGFFLFLGNETMALRLLEKTMFEMISKEELSPLFICNHLEFLKLAIDRKYYAVAIRLINLNISDTCSMFSLYNTDDILDRVIKSGSQDLKKSCEQAALKSDSGYSMACVVVGLFSKLKVKDTKDQQQHWGERYTSFLGRDQQIKQLKNILCHLVKNHLDDQQLIQAVSEEGEFKFFIDYNRNFSFGFVFQQRTTTRIEINTLLESRDLDMQLDEMGGKITKDPKLHSHSEM